MYPLTAASSTQEVCIMNAGGGTLPATALHTRIVRAVVLYSMIRHRYPTNSSRSSFLEESFGGLVRRHNDSSIRKYFSFVCTDEPSLLAEIEDDFSRALERK